MDSKILKYFEDLNTKAKNLNIAMDIYKSGKNNFNDELVQINSITNDVKDTKENLTLEDHNELVDEYNETRKIIERVTSKMFLILNHIENLPANSTTSRQVFNELASPAPKLFDRAGASAAFSQPNTPRMTIQEYTKSPLIKKKSRAQLNFSDFEAEIKKEDFDRVPSYIRGRFSLGEVQEFLEAVVIKCFNEKYELLYKNRSVLKQSEFQLQLTFKDQQHYFENQKFVTIGDLSRTQNKNIDKKDDKYLQLLRHLGIIKEVQKNSVKCFLWVVK